MKMRRVYLSKIVTMCVATLAIANLGGLAFAQVKTATAAGSPFQIKNIKQDMKNAPNYASGANAGELGGGRPSTISRQWLMLQVQFASLPTWADDVKIKYYVLMGKGKEMRMFTGEVTHINVAKGNDHFSVMFMHPNTVARYGAGGRVEAVAAVLYYEDKPVSMMSNPATTKRWWEDYTPTPGYLLNQLETPWSVIAPERFEALKSATSNQ
jgi:hypothetical protein